MSELPTLFQKWHNISLLKQIVWETQNWHSNCSRPTGSWVIDQNAQNIVLMNNSRTARPTNIWMPFLSLWQFASWWLYNFSNNGDNFETQNMLNFCLRSSSSLSLLHNSHNIWNIFISIPTSYRSETHWDKVLLSKSGTALVEAVHGGLVTLRLKEQLSNIEWYNSRCCRFKTPPTTGRILDYFYPHYTGNQ